MEFNISIGPIFWGRIGGWFSKGAMPEEAKHPLILSKDQHVSTLILKHVLTMDEISHCPMWGRGIGLQMPTHIRKIITNCGFCRHNNRRTEEQKKADHPMTRILSDLPLFTNTGEEYSDQLKERKEDQSAKNMESYLPVWQVEESIWKWQFHWKHACINALWCFISRRGKVVSHGFAGEYTQSWFPHLLLINLLLLKWSRSVLVKYFTNFWQVLKKKHSWPNKFKTARPSVVAYATILANQPAGDYW